MSENRYDMINDIDPTEKNLGEILRRIKNDRAELGSFGKIFHASSTSHADLTAAWKSNRRSSIVKASSERIQHENPTRKKIALVATSGVKRFAGKSMLTLAEM